MILLYTITPLIGLFRNYIKYKRCSFMMFIRTPLVYLMFHVFFVWWGTTTIVFKTIIAERWYWFLYKSLRSYLNNDYHTKKVKYIQKYKLNYD